MAKANKEADASQDLHGRFREIAATQTGPLRIDEEKGIIYDVLFLGTKKAGRGRQNGVYSPQVVQESIGKYEGVPTYVGHTKDGSNPDYANKLGVHRNVRALPEGGRSDFHFNVDHPCAKQLIWDAKNDPNHVGFSQDAECTWSQGASGRRIVKSIDEVYSLDLVTRPATTHGLAEEEGEEESRMLESDPALKALAESSLAAMDHARSIVFAADTTVEVKRERLAEALADWTNELKPDPAPAGKASLKEEVSQMEYKDLTLESLTKERPDLVEKLQGTDEHSRLTEEVKTLTEAAKTAAAELATLKAEKATRVKEEEIAAELAEAKFPVTDEVVYSAEFKEQIAASPDKAARAKLIKYVMGLASGRLQEQFRSPSPLADLRTKTADTSHQTSPNASLFVAN
jgi:hypothetical protein